MSKRAIVGGITEGGRLFKAGDEEALAKVLKPAAYPRLLENGAITGDWGVEAPAKAALPKAEPAPEVVEPVAAEPEVAAPAAPEASAPVVATSPAPAAKPARKSAAKKSTNKRK